MYIITNRKIKEGEEGLKIFGSRPSEKGPNELRITEVIKRGRGYQVNILDDKLEDAEVSQLAQTYDLNISTTDDWYASLRVACNIFAEARKSKKDILLYVHGYNNDVGDVVQTMQELEQRYSLIVVGFSWPANGGGAVSGTASYLSDKQDARASADALNRLVDKLNFYHELLTVKMQEKLFLKAENKFGGNPLAVQEYYSELLARSCKTRVNLMCHSMGNYLLKYALMPSGGATRKLIFDNVCLVAADANNYHHNEWVEVIQSRNRVYIVINEDDFALKWSRRKPGDAQRSRLGHHRKRLNAKNASYIDVTNTSYVGNSHSYFIGKPVEKNAKLLSFFHVILRGDRVEDRLNYRADVNIYKI